MDFQNYNDIINCFKEPYVLNKYSKKNKTIINKIIDKLKNNKKDIENLLKIENEFWVRNYSLDGFFRIIKKYDNLNIENNKKFGIGNIVAIETGDPYLHLELIINAILANCRIMFIANPTLVDLNMYITDIVRTILKEEKLDENLVSFVNILDYKDRLEQDQDVIDCIIINKDYEEYNFFEENFLSKVIYLDYGNINIYVDSDEYETTIDEIVNEAIDFDMDVYDYRIDSIDNFLKENRNNFIFNTAVIFSKDIKKCMRFYEAIKAKNIFINKFDINKIEIDLSLDDLQFEKKIITEK